MALAFFALRVGGIHHIAIKTPHVERLARFYGRVCEFEESKRHVDENGLRAVWFALDGSLLMIERSETGGEPRTGDAPGLHLFALRVPPDAHAEWTARLADLGVTTSQSDFTTYFRDPDGNRIGLSSWPEPRT